MLQMASEAYDSQTQLDKSCYIKYSSIQMSLSVATPQQETNMKRGGVHQQCRLHEYIL